MRGLVVILFIGFAQIGFGQDTTQNNALSAGATIITSTKVDISNGEPTEDYWNLSKQMFNFLIQKKSPTSISNYKVTSYYFEINPSLKSKGLIHTLPHETIEYKVRIEAIGNEKGIPVNIPFNWDTYNCGDESEKISNPKEIGDNERTIKVSIINESDTKRKKSETYIIEYGKSQFQMTIRCIKNFKLYKDELKNELFVLRVMSVVNYYSRDYGCVEILEVKE